MLDEERKRSSYGCSPDKVPENAEQGSETNWAIMFFYANYAVLGFDQTLSGPALNQMQSAPVQTQKGYYRPKEHEPANEIDPLQKPEGF